VKLSKDANDARHHIRGHANVRVLAKEVRQHAGRGAADARVTRWIFGMRRRWEQRIPRGVRNRLRDCSVRVRGAESP